MNEKEPTDLEIYEKGYGDGVSDVFIFFLIIYFLAILLLR